MYIAIDIGNTLQKAAVFSHDGEMLAIVAETELTTAHVSQLLDNFSCTHSILSSVGSERSDIQYVLSKRTQLTDFTHTTPLPIIIDYRSPQTLGLDRIASAAATHSLFPNENVLTIQAGTCLVADFVTANGHYLGRDGFLENEAPLHLPVDLVRHDVADGNGPEETNQRSARLLNMNVGDFV